MAKLRAALAALLLLSAPAGAQTLTKEKFSDFVKGLPSASTPLSGTDRLPVLQNGQVRAVLGTDLGGGSTGTSAATQVFDVGQYAADTTGATDATAAIQAAQAACAAASGGVVSIAGYRLLHLADITVAAGCPIVGTYVPHSRTPVDFSSATSALIHGSGATVSVGQGAELRGVAVLASTLPASVPTTVQQGAALVAGMASAGTGVTLTGHGATLRDVQPLGFALGVSSSGKHQLRLERVFADDYAGISISHSHDMSVLDHVEVWPFLTASQSWTLLSATVTGVADNGSGKIRFTTAAAHGFASGNTVFNQGTLGFTGANTKCTVALVNVTTFDCSNLSSAPTATGLVTSGSQYVKLASPNPSISNGQTITGPDIPGGTTISWYSPTTGWMKLTQTATGSNAAEALSFTNGAYVSGGTVRLYNDYREGAGFYLEDNVLLNCISCFSYAHTRGFDINAERNDNFIASTSEFYSALQDPTSVGIYVRGASRSNAWVGGYIHGPGTSLVQDSTDASPNMYSIPWIYQGPPATATVELLAGAAHISDTYIFQGHTFRAPFFIADTIGKVKFANNDFSGARGDWSFAASQKISSGETGFAAQAYTPEIASAVPLTGTSGTTIAAGTTTYAVHGQSTNVAVARESVPSVGVTRNLYVENSIAPGTGETQTVTIQRNGTDSLLTCTISDANRTCSTQGLGLEQSFVRGDTWVAKIVTSAAAATSTIKFGVEFVPTQLLAATVELSSLTADDATTSLTADDGATALDPL